jgi:hypothetical protein
MALMLGIAALGIYWVFYTNSFNYFIREGRGFLGLLLLFGLVTFIVGNSIYREVDKIPESYDEKHPDLTLVDRLVQKRDRLQEAGKYLRQSAVASLIGFAMLLFYLVKVSCE